MQQKESNLDRVEIEGSAPLEEEGELCKGHVAKVHVDLQGKQEGEQELVLLIETPDDNFMLDPAFNSGQTTCLCTSKLSLS